MRRRDNSSAHLIIELTRRILKLIFHRAARDALRSTALPQDASPFYGRRCGRGALPRRGNPSAQPAHIRLAGRIFFLENLLVVGINYPG